MSTYQYKPLDVARETRLLTLKLGDYDDPLIGSLSHVALSEQPSYEALSYVWKSSSNKSPPDPDLDVTVGVLGKHIRKLEKLRFGDLKKHDDYIDLYFAAGGLRDPGQITCDGLHMPIGGELQSALRRLRLLDRPRVLWIDALCIDQNNLEERAKHVQQMARIYAGAEKVLVWLGEPWGVDSRAFEVISTLLEKLPLLIESTEQSLLQFTFGNDKTIRDLPWDGLNQLLQRAWFERVWVIQEIANAAKADICIGSLVYDWRAFASVMMLLLTKNLVSYLIASGEVLAHHISTMLALINAKVGLQARPSLLPTLMRSRDFKCTLPHDMIYGVLGLCSGHDQGYVTMDYSVDAAEIYTNFTIAHITKRRKINVIYACAKTASVSELSLPSWVPDWTQPCHHEPYIFKETGWCAAKNSEIQIRFGDGNKSLFIHGRTLDTIAAVELLHEIPRGHSSSNRGDGSEGLMASRHMDQLDHQVRAMEAMRKWLPNVISIAFPDKVCTPEAYEALWRTFTCDQTNEAGGGPAPAEWAHHFRK